MSSVLKKADKLNLSLSPTGLYAVGLWVAQKPKSLLFVSEMVEHIKCGFGYCFSKAQQFKFDLIKLVSDSQIYLDLFSRIIQIYLIGCGEIIWLQQTGCTIFVMS